MQDCFWSFYNQRSQARYDGFKTVQARGFVSAIPLPEVQDWIVWKEGNPDWRPLPEFQELFDIDNESVYAAESEFNLNEDFQTDPEIERPNDYPNTITGTRSLAAELMSNDERDPEKGVEETSTGIVGNIVPEDKFIDISTLRLDRGEKLDLPRPDLRKSARYKRVMDVEIQLSTGKRLVTTTIDISMGGVLLNQHIPADAKKNVRMVIKQGSAQIVVLGQNIMDKHGMPSRRFKFMEIDQPDLLRAWILT